MATKITNSVLFRAAKWLTENGKITSEGLDTLTTREIVDMYELHSARYTVEYTGSGGRSGWSNVPYDRVAGHVAGVVLLGYRPEVWRESDRECMSGKFYIPAYI